MKRLKRRFFTWLLKNLDYYRLQNELRGGYKLDVVLENSIRLSAEEVEQVEDLKEIFKEAFAEAETDEIVKGYESQR